MMQATVIEILLFTMEAPIVYRIWNHIGMQKYLDLFESSP